MTEEKYPYPDVFFCPMGNDERITDTVDISYKPEAYIKAEQYFKLKKNNFTNFFINKSSKQVSLGDVSFWGTTKEMESVWKHMKPDDLIFFSKNEQGFVYMARILGTYNKELTKEINEKFWSNNSTEKNRTWDLIFLLKDVRRFNLSSAELNIFPGYGEKFIHRGLMRMDRKRGIKFWESFPVFYLMNQNKFRQLGDE